MIVSITTCVWSILMIIVFKNSGTKCNEFLISTTGCVIPEYNITFHDDTPKMTCGKRDVFVRRVSDDKVQFTMKKNYAACCYRYVQRFEVKFMEDKNVSFTKCINFGHQEIVTLKDEFVNVRCVSKSHLVYEDYYAFIKPIEYIPEDKNKKDDDDDDEESQDTEEKQAEEKRNTPRYNVLVIGMDTMSRKRAHNSLKQTVAFFKQNEWLDFPGYNKIGRHTMTNLLAVLTGSTTNLESNETCRADISACNDKLIWRHYQKKGYVTAYGEDSVYLNSTFKRVSDSGFSTPPTDHYMMPLFLAAEGRNGASLCTKRTFSAMQILNYILGFALTYKDKRKFFGYFWISSFSHDIGQSPKQLDDPLKYFFNKLKSSGILNDTFVIFFGDHGIRFGPARVAVESYHDERLPMLFMHAPDEFKKSYKFSNLEVNQQRLVSPYDLYLTLWDILKVSTNEGLVPKAVGCVRCMSLFHHMPEYRSCSDAGISGEWCTCHDMNRTSLDEFGAMYSLVHAADHLNNLSSAIKTQPCTKCSKMTFQKLLRIHSFSYNNETRFYVAAFVMNPEDVTYEVTVQKHVDHTNNAYVYDIVSYQLISKYHGKGYCALNKTDEHMCVCQNVISYTCTPTTPSTRKDAIPNGNIIQIQI